MIACASSSRSCESSGVELAPPLELRPPESPAPELPPTETVPPVVGVTLRPPAAAVVRPPDEAAPDPLPPRIVGSSTGSGLSGSWQAPSTQIRSPLQSKSESQPRSDSARPHADNSRTHQIQLETRTIPPRKAWKRPEEKRDGYIPPTGREAQYRITAAGRAALGTARRE